MSKKLLRLLAAYTIGATFALPSIPTVAQSGPATDQSVTTFDAPGAGTAADQGTFAVGNNDRGAITGFIRDSNLVRKAYLRRPDGTFVMFDAPGAGTVPGEGTRAYGINNRGVIAGYVSGNDSQAHGFVRAANGTVTTFDVPGAGTAAGQGTFDTNTAYDINDRGAIAGAYVDSSYSAHGYVRAPNGTFSRFDPANSIGTFPYAIDPTGAVTGIYCDGSFTPNTIRGFLRSPKGTITVIDVPGASSDINGCLGSGTFPTGIERFGVIEGNYTDANGLNRGFLRSRNGTFTTFDVPGAGTGPGEGTITNGNNLVGAITGIYFDSTFVNHGFVRGPFGKFVKFDAPGASTLGGQGTVPQGINLWGMVSGFYVDGGNVLHGFLANPFSNEGDTTAAPGGTTQGPKISLSQNVRRQWAAGKMRSIS